MQRKKKTTSVSFRKLELISRILSNYMLLGLKSITRQKKEKKKKTNKKKTPTNLLRF